MPINYNTLITQLNTHLAKHPGVTLNTDIFEHAFLQFLGYPNVPEKCQFTDNRNNGLFFKFRTPYNIEKSDFIRGLETYTTNKLSNIYIAETDPNSNQGFCVRLSVPYTWIGAHLSEIFQTIDQLLEAKFKNDFYRCWNDHAIRFKVALTIKRIENLVREKSLSVYLTINNVWSGIIQKNTKKNNKVKFLEKQVSVDVDHFPNISLIYEENGEKKEIVLTRDQIVATLEENIFDKFLTADSMQEFIAPVGIHQFIKETYDRSFYVNEKDQYEIDLGYQRKERSILKKYAIKELDSHPPIGCAPEQSQYYVYDKKNYSQLLIALKEINGFPCFNERWHQLTYYIQLEMWEELDKNLNFLLNLKTATGVEINYTKLLIDLHSHAKDSLKGKAQECAFEIIEKTCQRLEIQLQNDTPKEIYTILFELTLLYINQLKFSDINERQEWIVKLFILATKAGLAESNLYLGEIAGLELGNTFSANVNNEPLAVIIEIAKKHRMIIEENACLKSKLAKLEADSALKENRDSSKTETASTKTNTPIHTPQVFFR